MTLMDEIQSFEEHHDVKLPKHKVVCPSCEGEGTSVAYLGAYTQSDREEMGDDWYEFMDDVRAGTYDRPCEECKGQNVIDVIDEDRMDPELKKEWDDWMESYRDMEAMYAAERRMGC